MGGPAVGVGVEIRQVVRGDGESHLLGLAGGDGDLAETLQFLGRTLHRGFHVGDVELHCLLSLAVAGVGDGHGDGHGLPGGHLTAVGCGLAVGECGVAEAMPEGEEGLDLAGVVPAVADEDSLVVLLIPDILAGTFHAGIFTNGVGGDILKLYREGHRELARGVDLAEEDVGDGVARL